MSTLTLGDHRYTCLEQETVLDALLRENVNISFACKKGSCHSCMVRSTDVIPPELAQRGLKDTQKVQGFFLACQCKPEQDMTLKLPELSEFYTAATVITHSMLNRNTLLLVLAFADAFEFKAGQFVGLQRPDGLTRSYSIANTPHAGNTLEFHVRILEGGRFSQWLRDEISVGDSIAVSEAHGHCFYLADRREQGMLLVGTGTGLAPLAGILTDALAQGHTGPIYLFHGSRDLGDIYRVEEMRALSQRYPNFHYQPCLSGEHVPDGYVKGRVNEVVLATLSNLKGWRVFLCGHPDMVNQMKTQVFLKGAASADIYTDAFFRALN